MENLPAVAKEYRILLSRILGAGILIVILVSASSFVIPPVADIVLELFSFILVLIAAFGRLWSLSYISGHKTKDLIAVGPYSLVRNPLYLFSLLGSLGIGLATKNILVFFLIIILFALYYPVVIRAEEKHLERIHGDEFLSYKKKTPMFIPRFSRFREPKEYAINTRLFRRAFFSVMWFPLGYILILEIERLHALNLLPVLFRIP
ncbi:MAG: methyltransferase family protein [Desulfomonilia bacterium]